MNKNKDYTEKIFKIVQEFLKSPPVIIWGSGATADYGLPTTDDLKKHLGQDLKYKDLGQSVNLEETLEKIENQEKADKIKSSIRDLVLKKDIGCLKQAVQNLDYFKDIVVMIEKFYDAHPRVVNIITTNYDCVLEYALSGSDFNYTDGFAGRSLSTLNKNLFKKKEVVNLIKVHGSLNWFFDKSNICRFLPSDNKLGILKPAMILPDTNKYLESHSEPHRTLIAKSDEVIENAKSFLVIGFGFRDKHLTPKIDNKIKQGTPIVVITKEATDSCKDKLSIAMKYCLLECKMDNETQITFKKNGEKAEESNIDGKYWKLKQFMEIL